MARIARLAAFALVVAVVHATPDAARSVTTRSVRTGRAVTSEQRGGASAVQAMEAGVVDAINGIRREHGLPALAADPVLERVAQDYACRMASEHFFSHRPPGGGSVADRVRKVGKAFRVVGENLAMNENSPNPVETAVDGWMHSQGHRKNILLPTFSQTGVGVCRTGDRYYFTQVFLRPRG